MKTTVVKKPKKVINPIESVLLTKLDTGLIIMTTINTNDDGCINGVVVHPGSSDYKVGSTITDCNGNHYTLTKEQILLENE